ncbi:hypothetical protein ADL00_33670 [Streptomyces sp. AS58]|nr:hypothetical protein ADL00_33670 [Streptomyces sp. AS58]
MHSLLGAVLSGGRKLDLDQALHSIVEAAAVLVDAEYAALGPGGSSLSALLTVGVTKEQTPRSAPFPRAAASSEI